MNKVVKRLEMYNIDFGESRGSVQGGERPGVVLGNDIGNKYSPVVLVAPVTSKVKKPMPTHVRVDKDEIGLYEDSIILLEQIITIPKDRLGFKIATIPKRLESAVNNALSLSLGL
jgi:mRNA interferase MazF